MHTINRNCTCILVCVQQVFQCQKVVLKVFHVGIFFGGGGGTFFKAILMWLIEVQNVFLITSYDVPDRLGHVWDSLDAVESRKSIFHCQIFRQNFRFWRFQGFYKHFPYQGKLKVITRPQCALRFFIWRLDLSLGRCESRQSSEPPRGKSRSHMKKRRAHCGRVITLSFLQ